MFDLIVREWPSMRVLDNQRDIGLDTMLKTVGKWSALCAKKNGGKQIEFGLRPHESSHVRNP